MKKIEKTFGLGCVSVTGIDGCCISVSDYRNHPHFIFHRDHYLHGRSAFFDRDTNREFFYSLVEKDIAFEINDEGIYCFKYWTQVKTARDILVGILYDEGFQFKSWDNL